MSAKHLFAYGSLLLSLTAGCQSASRNDNIAPVAATPQMARPAATVTPAIVPATTVNATPAATVTPTTPANSADYVIAPGQRIGKIALEMPRSQVHELSGRPLTTYTLNGVQIDAWGTAGGDDYTQVYYRDDKAAQIEVAAPRFATASGLSTKSTPAQIQKAFPQIKQTVRRTSGEGENSEMRYYDAPQSGITFVFAQNKGFTVMVHKAGENALLNLEN